MRNIEKNLRLLTNNILKSKVALLPKSKVIVIWVKTHFLYNDFYDELTMISRAKWNHSGSTYPEVDYTEAEVPIYTLINELRSLAIF